MGSPGNSSYELKSILVLSLLFYWGCSGLLKNSRRRVWRLASSGGVVDDAAGMGGGDVASGYATLY